MEEQTQYSATNLKVEQLATSEDISDFYCGNKELDDFFHDEVMLCYKYKYLTPYCVKDIRTNEILALFTLSNDLLNLEKDSIKELVEMIPNEYKEMFNRQPSFPAINIGQLAVRKDKQSMGIGTYVIYYLVYLFYEYRLSGVQFITVDSLNTKETNKFYQKCGFDNQTLMDSLSNTRRMYLPLLNFE